MYVKVWLPSFSAIKSFLDLSFVFKEDLIVPGVGGPFVLIAMPLTSIQHYTFYDFIINKARGKSGPLFNFDVHDDVRLLADATKEKDESHAGKVVERSWYQRNKHIFPASRWEVSIQRFVSFSHAHGPVHQIYDPEKDYGKYTIA